MKRLILGSQSAARKKLFDALGIPFEVIPAHIDELAIRYPDLKQQTEQIARAKAEALVASYPDSAITTGDTVVASKGILMEKPVDFADAAAMMRTLSGNWCDVLTGYCYLDRSAAIDQSGLAITHYRFRELEDGEIAEFVKTFPVLTWSGAFEPGFPYVDSCIVETQGSHTSPMYGLPAEHIIPLLRQSGFVIHPRAVA
jgi:septum formation protein